MEITIDLIYGSATMNEIMHAADVFEPGKQVGTYEQASVLGNPNIENLCKNTADALMSGKQNVVFVGISKIDDKPVQEPVYIKQDVQSVSDGHKWCMFHEMLTAMGYEVTTDERMHVLTAKRIIDHDS